MGSILAECSDEEELSRSGDCYSDNWAPKIEDIIKLYENIKSNKFPELDWKCPGRKRPGEEIKSSVDDESKKEEPELPEEADDFDFEEEQTPMLRRVLPGKEKTPKGGAKKKTTSLAGILSNMERHRIMEKLEDIPNNNATPTPTTTAAEVAASTIITTTPATTTITTTPPVPTQTPTTQTPANLESESEPLENSTATTIPTTVTTSIEL